VMESYMDVLEDRADQEECYAWAVYEIERLRREVDRMASLAIDNARDTLQIREALKKIENVLDGYIDDGLTWADIGMKEGK